MTSWQPIENAPKDGTRIDLWISHGSEGGERVPDGYWVSTGEDHEHLFWDEKRPEGWAAANRGYDGSDGWADEPQYGSHVTHWMPIPEGPAE